MSESFVGGHFQTETDIINYPAGERFELQFRIYEQLGMDAYRKDGKLITVRDELKVGDEIHLVDFGVWWWFRSMVMMLVLMVKKCWLI